MCSQFDDPSQHDIPRPTEVEKMREISFGPIVNPDGSPSDFTRAMFGVRNDEDERIRHERRIQELLVAIQSDVEDLIVNGRTYSTDQKSLTLASIGMAVEDAYQLNKRIAKITWDKGTELRNRLICVDCGLFEEAHGSAMTTNHPFRNALATE